MRYVLSGSSGDRDSYVIEKQLQQLQDEAESLMEMMNKTEGDTDKYLIEIENKFSQIKALRNEIELIKKSAIFDDGFNNEFNRIISMFRDTDISFDEFDDVVIRRLVECIRVMKDRRIVVVLKGGLSAEDKIQ